MKHLRSVGFWILCVVSVFYLYGAIVHVLNMLGLSGFDWNSAPVKWQVLDIVYLILDVTVSLGLFRRMRISIFAFYIAAVSQIVLYTLLRSWIMDVPEPFTITPDQDSYLTLLVVFHVATLCLVTYALYAATGKEERAS